MLIDVLPLYLLLHLTILLVLLLLILQLFLDVIPFITNLHLYLLTVKSHQDHCVLPKYSWLYSLELEHGWPSRCYCLWRHLTLPLWVVKNYKYLFHYLWELEFIFLFLIVIGLVWPWTGFVHLIPIAVSSYVQLPCYIQKTLVPWSYWLSLTLTLFLSPLSQWILTLENKKYSIYVLSRVANSTVFFLCANHHQLQTDSFLLGLRYSLIYGYNDKSIGIVLM